MILLKAIIGLSLGFVNLAGDTLYEQFFQKMDGYLSEKTENIHPWMHIFRHYTSEPGDLTRYDLRVDFRF
jgi:hypothetical protein